MSILALLELGLQATKMGQQLKHNSTALGTVQWTLWMVGYSLVILTITLSGRSCLIVSHHHHHHKNKVTPTK